MKVTLAYWNTSKVKKIRMEEIEREFRFKLPDKVIYSFKMLQLCCNMDEKQLDYENNRQ